MDLDQLQALGLPVLKAQLHLHNIAYRKALLAVQHMNTLNITANIEDLDSIHFCFPDPGEIPPEFKEALNQYCNRLIGEKWMLEQAIEEIETTNWQNSLLDLF